MKWKQELLAGIFLFPFLLVITDFSEFAAWANANEGLAAWFQGAGVVLTIAAAAYFPHAFEQSKSRAAQRQFLRGYAAIIGECQAVCTPITDPNSFSSSQDLEQRLRRDLCQLGVATDALATIHPTAFDDFLLIASLLEIKRDIARIVLTLEEAPIVRGYLGYVVKAYEFSEPLAKNVCKSCKFTLEAINARTGLRPDEITAMMIGRGGAI
jgi:hypothetical protein